jgi:hypothetical protein
MPRAHAHRRTTILATAILIAGCSTARPPTAKLATADVAIREAEEADAARYAPLEMRLAREKLEKARRATDDDEHERARRLSEQAFVDAELAEAKADAEKARAKTEHARESVEALRGEAARPLRAPAPAPR